MAKSKRAKLVHLTKTKKKGREAKGNLMEQIKACVETRPYIYLFSVDNMRNTYFKQVRTELEDSRFFLGKNKVMVKALGSSPVDELKANLHLLSAKLSGNIGLLFSKKGPEVINEFLGQYGGADFARTGAKATDTIVIPEGPVMRDGQPFPHTLEGQTRQHGMPTILRKGIVHLDQEHTICREGDTLTADQAALLKLFLVRMAVFKVNLIAHYHDEEFVEH